MLPSLPDNDLETLTVHLARHAREVELILKGKPVESEPYPVVSEPTPRVTPIKTTVDTPAPDHHRSDSHH